MVILDQISDGLDATSAIIRTGANCVSKAGELKIKEMENAYVLKLTKKCKEKAGIDLKTEEGRTAFTTLKSAVLSL